MSVRSTILDQLAALVPRRGTPPPGLTDDTPLRDTGLDSLGLAVLVAQLDDALDLDPLSAPDVAFPRTVGDFIRLYEHAAA